MRGRAGGRCGHVHAFTSAGEHRRTDRRADHHAGRRGDRTAAHATDARAGVTVP